MQRDILRELLGGTKKAILQELMHQDLTVPEISKRLDVIEPGVRKHLGTMEKIGIVTSTFQQNGEVGRPKKYYEITALGRNLFPKIYDRVLSSLLAELGELRVGDDETDNVRGNVAGEMLGRVADELASDFLERSSGLSQRQKIKAFERFLDGLGFSTSIEIDAESGTVKILRTDCALYNVASKNYLAVCEGFDRSLVSKCLGSDHGKVKLVRCMALGKKNCEHVVSIEGLQSSQNPAD